MSRRSLYKGGVCRSFGGTLPVCSMVFANWKLFQKQLETDSNSHLHVTHMGEWTARMSQVFGAQMSFLEGEPTNDPEVRLAPSVDDFTQVIETMRHELNDCLRRVMDRSLAISKLCWMWSTGTSQCQQKMEGICLPPSPYCYARCQSSNQCERQSLLQGIYNTRTNSEKCLPCEFFKCLHEMCGNMNWGMVATPTT